MNTTCERPSYKYMFDLESSEELVRLMNQDRFVTMSIGGPLAGLPPLLEDAQVLDLGCGPGSWVLDVAFQRPQFEVAGIDARQGMVDYANARARSRMLSNASFGVMDVTNPPLDFANDSFDLINARFLVGILKREDWLPFVAECTRILRLDGIIRLVEADIVGETSSASLARLNELATLLFWKAGYGFSPHGHSFGVTPGPLHLLRQTGYDDTHAVTSEIDLSANTPFWANYYHNMEMIFLQMKPLLRRFELIGDTEFEQIYQQALAEICAPDFTATGHVTSIWARKKGCVANTYPGAG